MDSSEWISETVQQAKLHKGMCIALSRVLIALSPVFPSLAAVRPGSKPGLRALSGLELAFEKAKALLLYCATSSKLYLAMTGDSIVQRFSKLNNALDQNLVQLGEIVSESLSNRVALVLTETSQAKFSLEPTDKQVGEEIISVLLKEKDVQSGGVIFERIVTCLGLLSPKSLFEEQKALEKLLEKARGGGDKKKASILLYFLHLLKNYRKRVKSNSSSSIEEEKHLFSTSPVHQTRSDTSASCPDEKLLSQQPQILASGGCALTVPEQFRCAISSQVMSDPVIIASGQTYERVFIERWFKLGHNTCPKTQQVLPDLSMTDNICIKNLIASWCQGNGISVPEAPSSPDLSDVSWSSGWSFSSLDSSFGSGNETLSVLDAGNSQLDTEEKFVNVFESNIHGAEEHSKAFETLQRDKSMLKLHQEWWLQNLERMFADLSTEDWDVQCRSVKDIRMLTRDIPRALAHIEDNTLRLLVDFLGKSVHFGCIKVQEMGVLILLDLSKFDRENEERLVGAGVISYLLELLKSGCEQRLKKEALSLLMVLSSREENRKQFTLSGAIPVLIELLNPESCLTNSDTLATLCNLSTDFKYQRQVILADAVPKLVCLLKTGQDMVSKKCIRMLYHISLFEEGRNALVKAEDCIETIAELLGMGTNEEREDAVAVLLLLCKHSSQISQLIKREAVTSSLFSLSVQGSKRGKDMAKGLLQLLQK